jgi:hypothetical protein
LQKAIDALELSVSLFPLVDEYPGAPYRYQFRKRLEKQLVAEFAERSVRCLKINPSKCLKITP